MAKVPAPRGGRKGLPPGPAAAGDNLARPAGAALKPLNFRVSPEFHREFKTFAAAHGRSMVAVLYEAFDLVRAKHR